MGESVDYIVEEASPPPAPPMMRIARMNAPEWKYLVVGLAGAAGTGVVMPVFAIVFSRLLRVRH